MVGTSNLADQHWPDLFDDAPQEARVSPFKRTAAETISFILKLRDHGFRETALVRAFEIVSREAFAPRRLADLAMQDIALPLPCGQTMTAPLTVAHMLAALAIEPHHRVLEIGTGSGYVTALLGHLAREVVTVERYHALAAEAEGKITGLGLHHIRVCHGDGLVDTGQGRFDRILINGSVHQWPDYIVRGLAPGMRAIAVVADGTAASHLECLMMDEALKPQRRTLAPLIMPALRKGAAATL